MAYTEITQPEKSYKITQSGVHVFYWQNLSADMTFTIATEDADVYLFGLYQGNDEERFTLTTDQRHESPESKSQCLIKGVFDGASRFTYSGKISLTEPATKSEAHLTNRNLIVSEKALVSTEPQLDIVPADVVCSHAATVSDVDHDQIYALTARGLTPDQATQTIIQGFLEDLAAQKNTLT